MSAALYALLHAAGFNALAERHRRRQLVILCYHGVTEDPAHLQPQGNSLHVHRSRLARQLTYLRSRYSILPLREAVERLTTGQALPPRPVCVTFDDAYRNFYTSALPVLRELHVPASLFVITGRTADGEGGAADWRAEDDEHYLGWRELEAVREAGVEIGSHTVLHHRLGQLSDDEAAAELARSREVLVEHGHASPGLAYPYGHYNTRTPGLAEACGYTYALTTDERGNGPDANRHCLSRILIGDEDVPAFAARVSGMSAALRAILGRRRA